MNSREVSFPFSQQIDNDVDRAQKGNRLTTSCHVENSGSVNHKVAENTETSVSGSNGSTDRTADLVASESNAVDLAKKYSFLPNKRTEDLKKPDTLKIPHDFLCPISLELMRDPVIVATGQV
jgi:hypothetical protein